MDIGRNIQRIEFTGKTSIIEIISQQGEEEMTTIVWRPCIQAPCQSPVEKRFDGENLVQQRAWNCPYGRKCPWDFSFFLSDEQRQDTYRETFDLIG